jgi:WD40-like Beta Propeller Repeat
MASFLVRALGLSGGTDAFDDDDGSTHERRSTRWRRRGSPTGAPLTGSALLDPVTRDQMASFLAVGYQLAPSSTDFFDDDNGNLHEEAINALAASGITEGCDDGSYCPRSGVERDQMASFLGRAEGLTPRRPPLRRIAWHLDRNDGTCVLAVNGAELTEATCALTGFGLSWSPDGERLVFPLDDDLWLIDRTGDNLTQLTSQPGFDIYPAWSPDGTRIAFIRYDDGEALGDLFLINTDGGNELLLVRSTSNRKLDMPDWSPDGSLLAVHGFASRNFEHSLYTVNVVNGAIDLVMKGVGVAPEWSPDGKTILALRESGGNDVVTRVAADGSGRVDLTDPSFSSLCPGWSANGDQVVFTTHLPAPNNRVYHIWIMGADGSDMFRYTYYDDELASFPDWAP